METPNQSPSKVNTGYATDATPELSSSPFCSPLEDVSGLDVFAQAAASANPLPVEKSSATILQESQTQLTNNIYQAQQALRQQQQRRASATPSATTTGSSSYSDFDDDFDSEDDVMGDMAVSKQLHPSIKEEQEESDFFMDVDSNGSSNSLLSGGGLVNAGSPGRPRAPSLVPTTSTSASSVSMQRRTSLPGTSAEATVVSGPLTARRVIHNICERKRRENIRDGFARLQERVQRTNTTGRRLSKMEILEAALASFNQIKTRISGLQEEIKAFSAVNQ